MTQNPLDPEDFQFDDDLKKVFTDDVLATYKQMPYEMLVASAVLMKTELESALDHIAALSDEVLKIRQVLVSVIHLTGVAEESQGQDSVQDERPAPGQYI